ncbi:MAG: hypothetical protein ACD_44C00090G0001 [uncultured bacterium]|nr:MAG: hypothetical protein ACD_44C00090G0001 [uncultured bacterium]
MTSYAKAFVSHSSSDKPLLNEVVKQVSAARWEIDSLSFEEGRTSANEIFQSMSRSSLFVLFASQEAMNTEWVKSELEIAQHLYYAKKIGGLLVFIIDEMPAQSLPDWIRLHVFARTKNVTRIANMIRSRLMQLDSLRGAEQRPFVSRSNLRSEIEKKLSDLSNPVRAIYVSGTDGIGRRALVSNSLQTLLPGSDAMGINIPIADGEGVLEVYHKLFIEWQRPTQSELNEFFKSSCSLSEDDLNNKMVSLINEVGESKSYVWLQCDHAGLTEDGSIEPQFKKLLTTLDTNRPNLIIRARRSPTFADQAKTKNVAYFRVGSLSDEESRRLWFFALNHYKVAGVDDALVSFLHEKINGHPNIIWMAAEYVAQAGQAAIKANPRDFAENLHKLSLSLIDGLPLTDHAKRILSLFDEFGTISIDDLLAIFGETDQELADAVSLLASYSLLEVNEGYLRLAPFFQHARFRKRFSVDVDKFLVTARTRILDFVSNYMPEDSVSFSTIDSVIMAAIKEGRPIPLALDEKAIVGSHYLRVARSYFDRGEYTQTVTFCNSAFEKSGTLTHSAVIETLRLLGMSAIRTNDSTNINRAKTELAKFTSTQAKRHVHFISGFEYRWNGAFDESEEEFKKVLSLNPTDTHALRELSQLLLIREDYKQAEILARQAIIHAKDNPYLIDILLQCLIEQRKGNLSTLRGDSEIDELFRRLEVADKRERSTFFSLRRAHYFAALKNYNEALDYANEAISHNVQHVRAYAIRAEIKLSIKHDAQLLSSAESDIKELEKLSNSKAGGTRNLALIAKLRIRFELAKFNFKAAIQYFEKISFRLGKLRDKLAVEIANQIISENISDSDLVAWANRVLSTKPN